MPRAASRDPIYRRRRYTPEIIELCVRWYITYRLSYRDLVAMMAERGVAVSHKTIMRYDGKQKTLALRVYPDVLLDKARARHAEARRLLAAGVDPSSQRIGVKATPKSLAVSSVRRPMLTMQRSSSLPILIDNGP